MSDTFNHEADAWDSLSFFDADDHSESMCQHSGNPYYKQCKRCGAAGLRWGNNGNGYRLFDSRGMLHTCVGGVASPDEFEVIE